MFTCSCPLVIEIYSLYFFLRDDTLSPRVKGVRLPNNKELINVQFVNDTAVILELEEKTFDAFMAKMDLIFEALGRKVSLSKSIMLGWEYYPLQWFNKYGFAWGGPRHHIRYLGILFLLIDT